MIVRPTTNDRVEERDEFTGCHLLVVFDDFPDFGQKPFDVFLGRLDEEFAIVLTNVLT